MTPLQYFTTLILGSLFVSSQRESNQVVGRHLFSLGRLTGSGGCTGEPCANPQHCRSAWGFCGSSDAYCNTHSTWSPSCTSPTTSTTTTSSAAPSTTTTTTTTSAGSGTCTGEPCSIPNNCRSKWGYCGDTAAYCNIESIWSPACQAPTTTTTSTTSTSTTTGDCSGDPCADPSFCRSQWGFCGATAAYCNANSIGSPSCASPTVSPTTTATSTTTTSTTTSTDTTTTSASTTTTSTTTTTASGGGGAGREALKALESVSDSAASEEVMTSQQPDLSWQPSKIYKWSDMAEAVRKMYETGVGTSKLWLGDEKETATYGLVNVAAFVAQSMKETIKYDVCDENNWDSSSGYAASNSCGQLGQSYQDYKCGPGEEHMACPVDPDMMIRAGTSAKWYGAPAPMFCAPKSVLPEAPKWSVGGAWCNPAEDHDTEMDMEEYIEYVKKGEGCRDYEDQKDGKWEFCPDGGCPNSPAPAFGQEARTDVEGCCWWGRGVIQTTGVCNFGKLNWFIGKKAAEREGSALFPDIDFCKTPDAVCTSDDHPELKWVAGLFFWINEVQTYETDGWNYLTELKKFVDSGMRNPGSDSGFIKSVSGIVNRGCHSPPCASGPVDGGRERAQNFEKVLRLLGLIQ